MSDDDELYQNLVCSAAFALGGLLDREWPGVDLDDGGVDWTMEAEDDLRSGPIVKNLKPVRNVKPIWSKIGLWASLALGGFDIWVANLTGWNPLGTWKHGKTDAQATGKAKDHKPIDYP